MLITTMKVYFLDGNIRMKVNFTAFLMILGYVVVK